tara:strand:- start:166 stop:711 length:546 start_codon:yes stop_codon:yes gene_type:complete
MGVNKNKTKLGIKIQFEPKSIDNSKGFSKYMSIKPKLEVALQEKLNVKLGKYKMQVSKDTDVPRDEVIGFFIPLDQLKALVIEGLGQGDAETPDAPLAPEPTRETPPEGGEDSDIEEMIQTEMLNEMRVRDLNEASKIINKDDFYGFINAGNNIIRDMESAGKSKPEAKKYLAYLTKHNIM